MGRWLDITKTLVVGDESRQLETDKGVIVKCQTGCRIRMWTLDDRAAFILERWVED